VSDLLDVDVDVARAYLVAYPSALLRRAVPAVRGTVPEDVKTVQAVEHIWDHAEALKAAGLPE
jgi:hypothetical protein